MSIRHLHRDNYAETRERHVYPTFVDTPIGKLTPDQIRRWHRPLRERIPSTALRACRIMHAILATAVDDELVPRNPCRSSGAGSDPRNEPPFAPAEVVLALSDIAHPRIGSMILVAGFGGVRYGELRGLRVRHCDRLKSTLTVRESIDKRTRRKSPKTESSQRTVALPRFVLDAVDANLVAFVGGNADGPLFPGEAGRIISDGWFQREWRAAKKSLGVGETHFHDLRHTAGTIATQQGATMKEVMARLGHSTSSAAIRYQKAASDRDQRIADKLDDLVANIRTTAESANTSAPLAGLSRVSSGDRRSNEVAGVAADCDDDKATGQYRRADHDNEPEADHNDDRGSVDPDARVGFGYVMNSPGDRWQMPRTRRLVEALRLAFDR